LEDAQLLDKFNTPNNTKETSDKKDTSDRASSSIPSISLPKGGGAIRGIGEKFGINPVTGTGSLSVPIFTSPGRSNFGPQLSLSYDSGSGNGPFGFGWNLSLPSITRKTDKGIPRYLDESESDVYILSGAEDLVPTLINREGEWQRDQFDRTLSGLVFTIKRYRPRIEGLFARIERWTNKENGDTFWRSISKDNITTIYGRTPNSRIINPADESQVFSWLICESYDDKGNAIFYEYQAENSMGLDISKTHERNRNDLSRSANRYLKRIFYGNLTPRRADEDLSKRSDWLFEVVFDYDEGHHQDLPVNEKGFQFIQATKDKTKEWSSRQDPFSSYRAGFEIRTYRLCHNVMMFHHFPKELGTADYLVRSTDFAYDSSPIASFIIGITQSGYVRKADGTYLKKSLPTLELEYSQATIDDRIHEIDPEYLENLPYGLDGQQYKWIDLDGEGLCGILTEQGDALFYKQNLGMGEFGPVQSLAKKPSLASLNSGRSQLIDLAGDGKLDWVQFSSTAPGFFKRSDQDWEQFKSFASLPNIDWNNPNLRFIDLTGDGHADILIAEDEVFTWYESLAESGFGLGGRVRQSFDEEKGPKLIFFDSDQSIYLADMSGDGLTDLVRISNEEICYWPNLGYGRFGAKVTMSNKPHLDYTNLFDQGRIHLADIDGSGTTDIIILGDNGAEIYFNQSGNSWSDKQTLIPFPHIDNLTTVMAVDLFGNGTACLVWSSPLPGDAQRPMRYIDLMGGQKPHLLVTLKNNMGAETRVHYAPSTKFYLADKKAGRPWITRIPFPVHVVERMEVYDWISRNHFVTRYAYHHGYYDGIEREFRGFGMVEQCDTEEIGALKSGNSFHSATNIDEASSVPPVLTKTWFHTGAYLEGGRISRHFEKEYYRESDLREGVTGLAEKQMEAMLLNDTVMPGTIRLAHGAREHYALSYEEAREACRALKGSILRQEVYALDGKDESDRPYSVSERNYTIELLQPQGSNRYAVFFSHPRETIDFRYERKLYDISGKKLADPRVSNAMTLAVDDFGNVLQSVAIGYGRRHDDPSLREDDRKKQKEILATCTENSYTNPIEEDDFHRAPLPCETRTYELLNIVPAARELPVTNLFRFDDMHDMVRAASDRDHEIPYEDVEAAGALEKVLCRRLIEHSRTLYRKNDLSGPLALGVLESLALPYESYKLALTPSLIAQVYGSRVTEEMLIDEGRYVHSESSDGWWIPSGKIFYSQNSADIPSSELIIAKGHFFLPHRFQNPFDQSTIISYDKYNLLLLESEDPLHNKVTAGERDPEGKITNKNDYRVLQPTIVMDPNGNRSAVAFDVLGLVVGTSVMGKQGEKVGDSLKGFEPYLEEASILRHLQDPLRNPHEILQKATTRLVYDLYAYQRSRNKATNPQPNVVYAMARETHDADLQPGELTKVQHRFSYYDGFGREIQKKMRAEPGDVEGVHINPRWVGSGWTIFNKKGKPVKQYEQFFSATHGFEFARVVGVSSTLFYDPLGRVVATLHPNHTYEKVVFDPWRQETWDTNDTVLQADPKNDTNVSEFFKCLQDDEYLPTWHEARRDGLLGREEQMAACKSAKHAETPTVAYFDSLGRTFLVVANNGPRGNYSTRVKMDIEGHHREVADAKGRIVMRYKYDMLGSQVHQSSMEAGERCVLNDTAGKPIMAWDSRGHVFRTKYDALRRPLSVYVKCVGTIDLDKEILLERTEYGEGLQDDVKFNLRTKGFNQFDSSGIVTNEIYDFKGNLLKSCYRYVANHRTVPDWSFSPLLAPEIFVSSTTYDALNRPISMIAPDESKIIPTYNETNLLKKLEVNLQGDAQPTIIIKNIDYDAKGQKESIEYGNNVRTTYKYDEKTYRLNHIHTLRGKENLQDLFYFYDPVGNVTSIWDNAQQAIYFNKTVVRPNAEYTYDAIYRLIQATGREHIGQALQPSTWSDRFRINLQHPNDGKALRRYSESYEYDNVGNILRFIHHANSGNWVRDYIYEELSQIENGYNNNRLSRTCIGSRRENYMYNVHGSVIMMPHLPKMDWNSEDQLHEVDLGSGGKAYYIYNSAGQRARKVIELRDGRRKEERFYIGEFEIFRKYDLSNDIVDLERKTLHIMHDKECIALIERRELGNDPAPEKLIRYQLNNHLGSANLEIDSQAKIISYEEYYPYGSTSYQAVRSQTETPKRYRFTGKERDEETGLYYYGARYYAAWLGKWTSADPIGIVDGINLFVYARNNPLIYTDPTGTQCDLPPQSCDPDRQSCIDPTAPTPLEEAEQKCIPEEHSTNRSMENPPDPPRKEDTCDVMTKEQIAQQENEQFSTWDLPPDKLGYGDLEYLLVYDLKQTVYKPLKSWLVAVFTGTPEQMDYLDSEHHVQQIPVDRSGERAYAIATLATLIIAPEGNTVKVAEGEAKLALQNLEQQTLEQGEYLIKLNKTGGVPADAAIKKGNQVLEGIEDTLTGQRFFDRSKSVSEKLYPALENEANSYRIIIKGSKDLERFGPPGAHGGINALNRALWAADPSGELLTVADFGRFNGVSVWLGKGGPYVIPRCPHCWFLSPNVRWSGALGPR
jgi:RHS repeat-associated protein